MSGGTARAPAAALAALAITVVWVSLTSSWAPATATSAEGPSSVTVELSHVDPTVGPGEQVSFDSRLRNTGDVELSGLVAHLNILSSDPDVYVDPEDWSSTRTQLPEPLPAGGTTSLEWTVRAVDSGPLTLYVAVSRPDSDTVVVSQPLHVTVAGRRVVDPGGVVPLVMATPAAVLGLLGLALLRRRLRR